MKKIFYLIFAALCIVACSEKNTPTNPEGDNPENPSENPSENPGENPGENPENPGTNVEKYLLATKFAIWYEYANGESHYNASNLYEYNEQNDLIKLAVFTRGVLTTETRYTWNGNTRYGISDVYSNGSISYHSYDTVNYIDNKRYYVTRNATRSDYKYRSFYQVNLYEYDGEKLMRYKYYENDVLYRNVSYSHVGDMRYGKGEENLPNSPYLAESDTTKFLSDGRIADQISWYTVNNTRYVTRSSYTYKNDGIDEQQLNGYRFETVYYDMNGTVTTHTESTTKYTWKGDTVRIGYGELYSNGILSNITRDTFYYKIATR